MPAYREPGLEIELLGRSIVERARHDSDHPVGNAKRLIELLRSRDHGLEHLPRPVDVNVCPKVGVESLGNLLLRVRNAKLFDLALG